MTTSRVMTGVADFGGQKVNSLRIGPMVGRRPEPRYNAVCEICKAQTIETQSRIRSGVARCLNSGCGKDHLRDHLEDTPSRARKRAEAQEAAKRREREEREAAELAETETQFKELSRKVNATIRENILKLRDDEFKIDPETFSPIPKEVFPEEWNAKESQKFIQANPGYYPCKENLEMMTGYIDRNAPDIKLVSALQWTWAFERLKEFGLLRERPTPQPKQRPQPTRVNLTIDRSEPEPVRASGQAIEHGWDESGNPIALTRRDVDRLSSTEYRKFKRLDRAALEASLPRFGPGVMRPA